MGNQASTGATPEKSVLKEHGRRRVFVFFWGFVIVAISGVITEEMDMTLHVADDYVDIIAAVIVLALYLMWRNKTALADLKKANNIATVFAVVLVLATIFAITQEIGDPTDFGNEIPTLFFGVFMLVNRFL